MASIRDLLNPLPEPRQHQSDRTRRLETPPPLKTDVITPPREKRTKMVKDGAVFRAGSVHGELRYPPCEERDEHLTKLHTEWRLHPMGKIADYPRHIPYQSEKKSFQERTGRDSFHVFQYTFQVPGVLDRDGKPKEWVVMWDYNIGLVRTTHLFKCLEYPKTTPAKVLSQNTGLRDICHSITGGSLAAQGYWMPYEAAKAIAATFCWKIRYILTPLFGTDFPSLCISPSDRARFGRMIIDPAIVQRAAGIANKYQALELQTRTLTLAGSENESATSSTSERRAMEDAALDDCPPRQLFPKVPRHRYTDSVGSARDSSSEPYCVSPHSPTGSTWTPVNRPPPRSSEIVSMSRVPSPAHYLSYVAELQKKHRSAEESEWDTDLSSEAPSDAIRTPELSPSNEDSEMPDLDAASADVDTNASVSDMSLPGDDGSVTNDEQDEQCRERRARTSVQNESPRKQEQLHKTSARSATTCAPGGSGHFAHEVKAAHALLRLHMQEATNADDIEDDHWMDEGPRRSVLGLALRPSSSSSSRKRRRASL